MSSQTNTIRPGNQRQAASITTSKRRSRWLMRAAAVLLSLAPIVVVEVALRWLDLPSVEAVDFDPLASVGPTPPLFELDPAAGRWEIPASRSNFFRPASFAADKPITTRRVFVLGGSTVQGRPYETETAFSTWLQLRLAALDPEHDYEVVNCGGVSYASYRVARIFEEVLRHQPDALVLYTGHNEFLEDRTYADVRSLGVLRRLATRIAAHSRIVQLIQQTTAADRSTVAGAASGHVSSAEVETRLDRAGGLAAYRRDPLWRRGVERQFQVSLRRMVSLAAGAGVPLILCTPASDLVETPPFKIQVSPDLSIPEARAFNHAWETAQDTSIAAGPRRAACRECLAIDPLHAGANYLLGSFLLGQGKVAEARQHLVTARDHDVCPLRATTPIIEAVRAAGTWEADGQRLAQQENSAQQKESSGPGEANLDVVETIALLDTRSWRGNLQTDGIPDPEFFVDHVHPTVAGHQRIALAVADRLAEFGWFEPTKEAAVAYQAKAAEHLASLPETYFHRGKARLEGLRRWASGRAGQLGTDPD